MSHQNQAMGSRNGFTLLELLIVLGIAAAVAMIAIPSIDVMGMRVSSSARQVGMTLLNAQRLAILKQHTVIVSFDTAHLMVGLHEDRNNNGTVDAGENRNFVKLEDGVVFGRGSAPAATFGEAAITFEKSQAGMPMVAFNRSGSAGEYGGFYMTSKRSAAAAQYARDTRGFEVNRGTGRTIMYGYSNLGWKRSF